MVPKGAMAITHSEKVHLFLPQIQVDDIAVLVDLLGLLVVPFVASIPETHLVGGFGLQGFPFNLVEVPGEQKALDIFGLALSKLGKGRPVLMELFTNIRGVPGGRWALDILGHDLERFLLTLICVQTSHHLFVTWERLGHPEQLFWCVYVLFQLEERLRALAVFKAEHVNLSAQAHRLLELSAP